MSIGSDDFLYPHLGRDVSYASGAGTWVGWPYWFHTQTVPSAFRARVLSPPMASATMSRRPSTGTGGSGVDPLKLTAQTQTLPSAAMAPPCSAPTAIAVMGPIPSMAFGAGLRGSPQVQTLPSACNATLGRRSPAPTATTLSRSATRVGLARSAVPPQAQTVPSACTATPWTLLTESWVMSVSASTLVGDGRSVVVPVPSCPDSFAPQAHTLPSASKAKLLSPAAATIFTPRRPGTATGTCTQGRGWWGQFSPCGTPTCPWSFLP